MARKTKGLIVLFLLGAALFFYAIGSTTGVMFLLIIGACFELLFWAKLFRIQR